MRYLVVLSVSLMSAGAARTAPPTTADIEATIQRSLKFLVQDNLAWKKQHNCMSCHHAAFSAWALNEAKTHGYAVDEPILAELTAWVVAGGDGAGRRQKPPPDAPKALNAYSLNMALVLASDPRPGAKVRETLAGLRKVVLSDQIADGSWVAWPQTRAPIFGPSNVVATAQAALALTPAAAESDDAVMKAARARALKWLDAAPSDDELQALALRLILRRRTTDLASQAGSSPLVKQILDRQNADGGWSQTSDMESDAYATGQALYALAEAGLKADNPAIQRGHTFLVLTQQPDGAWEMTSRPCPPSHKGATNLIPITGAGAAWGTMGLVRSSPRVKPATATETAP